VTPATEAARTLIAEIAALPVRDTPSIRQLRRARSRLWRTMPADFVVAVALALTENRAHRWVGYELVRFHVGAFSALNDDHVAALAMGLDSWDSVDAYARILSGPAWAQGLVSDRMIADWRDSPDRWLRRAALVSTVALNTRTDGGRGDTARSLAVCARLAGDRDDMVVKALSWALRALAGLDADAVQAFLDEHDVAARVRREVGHKLRTGLKSPRRRGD
jgi:3-methyladenine DNA glycosylase AlkD